jgi:integrase/recombinase XerD
MTITLKKIVHRNEYRIGLFFPNLAAINAIATRIGARYSKTWKCWYLSYDKEQFALVKRAFAGYNIDIEKESAPGFDRKAWDPALSKPAPVEKKREPGPVVRAFSIADISDANLKEWLRMEQRLHLKGYSPSTLRTYRNEFGIFLKALKQVPADSMTEDRLRSYLQYCHVVLKLSENTIHSRINALKFYYEQVLKRDKFFWDIPRPKKHLQLPKLLNEEELRRLFNALTNRKHKAMLFTAYSAGLRVSEIVSLKLSDIDSRRMQILVERAKGKKDRYVNLSPVLLDILRKYIKLYVPPPREYLFESEESGTAYPVRTVQQIFSNAKRRAGIRKDVGIHSLRHSFATHLLDKGTDIRYIKELLGHFNIRTTERYLHVSKQKLVNIVSPLDDLMRKEDLEW